MSKNIIIWRDSVAAGDDVSAPHETRLDVESDESIETTVGKIVAARYLPSIQGEKQPGYWSASSLWQSLLNSGPSPVIWLSPRVIYKIM